MSSPAKISIDATVNYEAIEDAYQAGKSGIVLEGGSRSGKTWQIIIWHYISMLQGRFNVSTLGRDTFATFKKTVWIDMLQIMPRIFGDDMRINQTELKMQFGKSLTRCVGLNDDIMLTHGLTQDFFWINEAMNIGRDTFDQLEQRTSSFWIVDYNPTATDHWLYDLANREDVAFKKTTILDNPFAPAASRRKIFSYEPTQANILAGTADLYKWKVYGLGERAADDDVIFQNIQRYADDLEGYDWRMYGGDFGFSDDPSVVIEVTKDGRNLYLKEMVWDFGLTNQELAEQVHEVCDLSHIFVFDSAENKSIKELRRAGVPARPAQKGADSVRYGIDKLKQYRIFVHVDSERLFDEFKNYKWAKNRQGEYVRDTKGHKKPIDDHNHGIDSTRYALTKFSKWA